MVEAVIALHTTIAHNADNNFSAHLYLIYNK